MSNSDPHHSRSKEKTAPRRGDSPSLPEKGKKQDKKIEPTVLVAIISAVVTLVTALLSSPVLLALLDKTPTSAPSIAGLGMSGTLFPETTEEELTKATNPPADTQGLPSPTLAVTNPGETTTSPTLAVPVSVTETNPPSAPENTPVSTQAPSLLNCLSVDLWFPYPATLNPDITNGCWNLADWGFTTDQGQLSLIHNPDLDQQRGIYLPLSGDLDIQFTLQMTEFRTRSNKGGFLHFGIVQNDPFSNFNGGFLSYQQPTPGASSPIRVLVSGNNQATQNVLILDKGFQQNVVLSIQGDVLTVFLDGQPVGDPVNLTPTDRAFWIGYVLPARAELEVLISEFAIQVQ